MTVTRTFIIVSYGLGAFLFSGIMVAQMLQGSLLVGALAFLATMACIVMLGFWGPSEVSVHE